MADEFDFGSLYHRARNEANPNLLIQALPYAQYLGMEAQLTEGQLRFLLPPIKTNIGNPSLPALHGGAIAGFMEMSAVVHLLMCFTHEKSEEPVGPEEETGEISNQVPSPKVPKIIDFSIDYIRACRFVDTWCECEMVRQGRRVANLAIRVWQSDPQSPAAAARAHYLLD